MILWADSCSSMTPEKQTLKYRKLSGSGFNNIETGRYTGWSYYFAASIGQTKLERILPGPTNVLFDSRSFLVAHTYNLNETITWLYYQGIQPIAAVTLGVDGRLRIYSGGGGIDTDLGAAVYTSQTVFAIDTWYSVDLAWDFPTSGMGGSVALYVNDVLDTIVPGQPSAINVNWPGVPDRFDLCFGLDSTYGYQIGDLVVNDNSGLWNNTRLGPCEVALYYMFSDVQNQWVRQGTEPGTGNSGAINELPHATYSGQAPDEAVSYTGAAVIGLTDYFLCGYLTGENRTSPPGVQGMDCYGLILGICMSACILDPVQTHQQLLVVPQPSTGTPYDVGSPIATTNGYFTSQAVTEINPATNMAWTDGDAGAAWWGIECLAGTPNLTQLVLEKVTSTRAVPYSCGGAQSYTYMVTSGRGL
jgi:hypothetical protein